MTPIEQQEVVQQLIEARRLTGEALGKLGVHVLNGATEEGVLRSNLSEISLLLNQVGQILGATGPARELPAFATLLMEELKRLRSLW